ncbi:MAG: hypothetical protein EBR97_01055 [Firmicutes bacterium]|nr:hypothetical protein [Bacillota bacterium]
MKRFSTLLLPLLVAGCLSLQAQAVDEDLVHEIADNLRGSSGVNPVNGKPRTNQPQKNWMPSLQKKNARCSKT